MEEHDENRLLSLYSLGVTMLVLKTFYWYQLHQSLGPLAITVKKIMKDIFMISIAYLIFFLAFSFGIGLIMNESEEKGKLKPKKNCEDDGDDNYNAFQSWFAPTNTDKVTLTQLSMKNYLIFEDHERSVQD